ncbi:glucose-1-phosphate cytidylyltransferase [Peribacillus sp. NPDC094092]|uniref:glucose-1-phosphate cytidylyltransferase n=1 Tax=Peribacillus sp. NPDC094092 TaxID=3390611 RepID=UPI003CFF2554
MKVVILAGGYGTRISEETDIKPKPMIEIGQFPIIWHIMKVYSFYGFNEFVLCLGYKSNCIIEYFCNYYWNTSDITIDFNNNNKTIHSRNAEPWKVTLVDTGIETMTGGRIRKIKPYVGNERFLLTYGDGVADINIPKLVEFHEKHGKIATLTSVVPNGRFGSLTISAENKVIDFKEKKDNEDKRINAGFFVLEPEIFELIEGDYTVFENDPLELLAKMGELFTFKHEGFWHPMDTLKDKNHLETLWKQKNAPWKIWG